MKKSPTFLLLGLGAAGLLSGVTGRLAMEGLGATNQPPAADKVRGVPDKSPAVDILPRQSSDTLETLAALDNGNLYQRLALWIIDASEAEIAGYWNEFLKKGDRSDDITGLVFLGWTRLNPQAAIAATAGTPDERHAWWAWASHDPQAALAAAIAANPERINDVVRGIGEFHPDWLRRHFGEIPASSREHAIRFGLFRWGNRDKAMEMLHFSREHGVGLDRTTFKALIRMDPWSALDWVTEFPKLDGHHSSEIAIGLLVSQLAEENPEALARMAARMPSGAAKRAMEAALFDNLIKADPQAAIEQAMAIQTPRTAAERLAAVGLSLVKSDPAQALEMAEKLLTACPNAMMMRNTLQLPHGNGGGWGRGVPGVSQFLESLLREDPARLLDIVSATRPKSIQGDHAFHELSEQWLARDVTGFAEWVNGQTDELIRDRGARMVASQLVKLRQYQDAAEWAMALPPDRRITPLWDALYPWELRDAAGVRAWVENSKLSAEDKIRITNNFGR